MRRKDKEISEPAEMEAILRQANVCRLALWDGEWPYIVSLCFGYRAGVLYFHSAKEGKKIDILQKNNRVAFSVDLDAEPVRGPSACRWTMKYRSIMGQGEVSFLQERAAKEEALRIIMTQYGETETSFIEENIDSVAIFQVRITQMTGKKSGC